MSQPIKANPAEIKEVLQHASVYETYIINMNGTLQARCEQLLTKNADSENRIQEFEQDLERTECRLNYTKDLLKNFHEMHKWNEEIARYKSTMEKTTRSSIINYKSRAAWHLRTLHCIFVISLGVSWELVDTWIFSSLASLLCIIVAFQWSMWQNIRLPLCQDLARKVQEVKDKKEKVLEAQDYIHGFIESQ